jgi:hypothetical protein
MRVLLVLMLFASLALAEENFGPIAVQQNGLSYSPKLMVRATNELLYLWGPMSDTLFPGLGQRLTLNGASIGDSIRYENVCRRHFECPASVTLVPLTSGGEARMIAHS